jgi:replicative DNA helicase
VTTTAQAFERTVLGALLLDNSQLAQIQLSGTDFVSAAHRQIFDATKRMICGGSVCDALTVAELLEQETGRKDWLAMTVAMVRECLAPSNAPAYAVLVRRDSISRQATAIAERLGQEPTQEVIDSSIRDLMALSATQKDFTCHQIDAAQEAIAEMMLATEGRLSGVSSGIRDLDESLGGFHAGDLIVVGARPAMGKTAFMLNLAAAAGKGVGIISGEQGRAQIGMRQLAINGDLSLHRMRTGVLENHEWERITKTMMVMKDRPVWIYDKPRPSIDDVVRQARAWKFNQDIKILMVDYLQMLTGGNGESFRLKVGDIAAQLKCLARELEIPNIVLAQVNREVEKRPMGSDGMGRMPYMADFAESGIIEMECDVGITLYRPEVYEDLPQYRGIAFANICKNRHGPVGFKGIAWRGEYLQFGDLAKVEMQQADRWARA